MEILVFIAQESIGDQIQAGSVVMKNAEKGTWYARKAGKKYGDSETLHIEEAAIIEWGRIRHNMKPSILSETNGLEHIFKEESAIAIVSNEFGAPAYLPRKILEV